MKPDKQQLHQTNGICAKKPKSVDVGGLPLRTDVEAATRLKWRGADAVCFDVDSTVCIDEAIDELAEFCGVGQQVAAWTRKAMNGNFSFRTALAERLQLIAPTRAQVEAYARQNAPKLTPGVCELVRALQARGTDVFLVSGGFRSLIVPVARLLHVPDDHVYANVLLFDHDGNYAGFDEDEPTSDSHGKAAVCGELKDSRRYKCLVMVGDGATDMEAAPPADAFIGFGGNQVRDAVRREAPWYVFGFGELLNELTEE